MPREIAAGRSTVRGHLASDDHADQSGPRAAAEASGRTPIGRCALDRFHHGDMSRLVEADLTTARKLDLRYRSPASVLNLRTVNALLFKPPHFRREVIAHE